MSGKARLVLIAIVLLVAGGSFYYFTQNKKADQKNAFQTVAVRRGTIEQVITSQGKLEPKEYVDVGAQVSGQLKKIYFEIGDQVKKGDLLAELDPRVYESKVAADQAKIKNLNAQINEQNAQIALAEAQYKRNKTLVDQKAVSQDVFDTADTNLKAARAQGASLKAQLEEAQSTLSGDQANLSYTKIYAPMDGTVTTQPVREGQTVNATQTAPTIMQVANLSVMTARAQVAEADVTSINPDMKVYFTTLGSERKWNATVRQVLPSPETVNDVVLYNVLVDVENPDNILMTGMSTQMFFERGRADNVLIVPVSVLGGRVEGEDKSYKVRILQNGKPVDAVVQVGLQTRAEVEILSGANEGDQIILNMPVAKDAAPAGGSRRMGPRI